MYSEIDSSFNYIAGTRIRLDKNFPTLVNRARQGRIADIGDRVVYRSTCGV